MSNENYYHPKRVSNLGMEVIMGKRASRSRRREEECKQTREGGGTIERVRRYRRDRSDFRHPAMIGLPPPSSMGKVGDSKDINCKTKNYLHK
jgi:hypothetical protein